MSQTVRNALLLATSLLSVACTARESTTTPRPYPVARTVDAVDILHGRRIPDPYRWLEDLDSKEVRDWAAAQSALALPLLRENQIRPWVLKRAEELSTFWSDRSTEPDEPPLIDDRSLQPGQAIAGVWPSPNGKHVVYAISTGGSEWVETRIRRTSDNADLDERLEGLLWTDPTWTRDNRGFFYVRSIKPALGERTAMKGPAVYYHVTGTPQSNDVAILRLAPEVTDLVLEHEMSEDGRYVFIYEGNGADVDGLGWMLTRMYAVDLGNPLTPAISAPVLPLSSERDAAYRVIATRGDRAYLFTDRGAPKRRLAVFDVKNPAPSQWRDVIPQTDDVIDEIYDINGQWVVKFLRNVQHGLRVYSRNGELIRELAIPPMTVITDVRASTRLDELVVEAREGFAPTRKRFNTRTGAVIVERRAKLPFPEDAFEIKQVWYASRDGTQVPMFLLHRRGLVRDGTHPVVLAGYGASSQFSLPFFDEFAVATLELGMVIALPALRGGGEFGRSWYEAGTLERKQNTFDDFIAAAEYLVREKYTTPDRLAIVGSSNGGLLVTAVINQRPELFRVAIADVPQTDNVRYDRGRHNTQFGTPKNPAHLSFLLAYSPLHNVKPGVCHPSTLLTTALNDERAAAWMALKHTATLQAAQGCARPIILRANIAGGHGGDRLEDAGDFTALIATQLGVKLPATAGR